MTAVTFKSKWGSVQVKPGTKSRIVYFAIEQGVIKWTNGVWVILYYSISIVQNSSFSDGTVLYCTVLYSDVNDE